MTDFAVKNLKSLASGAYTTSLYEDGKRVAIVSNEGRGGPDSIQPLTGVWRDEVDRLEAALTQWSRDNVPDWYLTSSGVHAPVSHDWAIALGYLAECWENDRLAKPGWALFRRPNGALFTAPEQYPAGAACLVWRNHNWEAAA
jgi:hypothetical protein